MAYTRAELKTLIESHTGRTDKDTLESYLCNIALKVALEHHNFQDAQSEPSDISITEDATSISLSGISNLANIVTARVVEASGSRNKILPLKTPSWWDKFVINSEDNQKGWPCYGHRKGTTLYLDRPAESGLEIRLRVTTWQTFTSDSTACPIACLDVFVEHYVTAHVFKDLTHWNAYNQWIASAMGTQFLSRGIIGGELKRAMDIDSDDAVEIVSEPMEFKQDLGGISVTNLDSSHEDYGNTRWWT